MRILIVNDDGIHAPGMIPLIRWAKKYGDVKVVAPDSVVKQIRAEIERLAEKYR